MSTANNLISPLQDDVLIGSTEPTILSVNAPKEVSIRSGCGESLY